MFRVGIFLDFVWLTTRTMHPHGGPQYVRGARRNRIDPHGGGIERPTTRTWPGSAVDEGRALWPCSRTREVIFFGWAFFLISFGGQAPHVLRPTWGVRVESHTKWN